MINRIALDINFYKRKYSDLNNMTKQELAIHYYKHGYYEGRECNSYCIREKFIALCNKKKTLEIGPFVSPQIKGDTVYYADILSTMDLKNRAKKIGLNTENTPKINYIIKDGTLSEIRDSFDCVFSSHNIEHQPDLITHLEEVYNLLSDSGKYYLIIPHCNFCFDANLPPTKISEVFNAYYEKRKVHTIGSIIEHRAMTTHNNPVEHWKNNQSENGHLSLDRSRIKGAIDEYKNSNGRYIDVHAWQFTPLNFLDIVRILIDLGFIKFSNIRVSGQVKNRGEFTAIIEK